MVSLDRKIIGNWNNSWSPVNDQIRFDTMLIEIGFNTTRWVRSIIEEVVDNHKITCNEFAFRPYTFFGLLETSKLLSDKQGFIQECRSKIRPIPKVLKKNIVEHYLPELKELYLDLVDSAKRNIGILAFEHFLFRGLDHGADRRGDPDLGEDLSAAGLFVG